MAGDVRVIHAITLSVIRQIKDTDPKIADELAAILAYSGVGASPIRSLGMESAPRDADSRLDLVKIEEFDENMPSPVLGQDQQEQISRFLLERTKIHELIANGLRPSTSLLLVGPPGVGKTFLSQYISSRLGLPLVTLDLATVISSYLGRTGQNIKIVFEYARANKAILLLDEFDAVAKRRDDESDLGELKRIVNVLLKELENWPIDSLVIGATNHPELLDKAIWRRFDHKIELTLPGPRERAKILDGSLGNAVDDDFKAVLAEVTENLSGADLTSFGERVRRRTIIENAYPIQAAVSELKAISSDIHKFNGLFCKAAKRALGSRIKQKDLAQWLDITPATVSHHLKGE